MKELLFSLTKPEMAAVYSRYSAEAPEPLSAQFNNCIDRQSAVKAYKEKCGKMRAIQLFFPTDFFLPPFGCRFLLIFASQGTWNSIHVIPFSSSKYHLVLSIGLIVYWPQNATRNSSCHLSYFDG